MAAVEVGAKLVLDDHASAALGRMRDGFHKVGAKVTEVQHEMAGMAKQALATAAGFQLSGVVDTLKELGMEALHAAAGTEEQVRGLAGLISMTDKTGMSYEETLKKGAELKDQLEGIGIKAGSSADSVVDAFSMIAERSSKSTEEVAALTEQLAMAGRATGGTEKLAAAWRDMETGIIRPKNALVMLMRQTGVVTGSAKEVAKSLTGMMASGEAGKAKGFELAEMAVARMATKMKDAPLTFKETIEGLKILRENVFEALGGPMVKAITPALENVKKYMQTHKAEIEHFAETMGTKVGVWATDAAKKVEEGFAYLKTHADEIEAAIVEGAKTLKEVITFILAHKEEIALAYGVKTVAPLVGGAIGGARTLAGALSGGGAGGVTALGGAGTAAAGAGAAGAAMLVAATAAAAAAWYGVYDQAKKLYAETGGFKSEEKRDIEARMDALRRIASKEGELTKTELADYDANAKAIIALGTASGENTAVLGQMTQAIWDQRMTAQNTQAMLEAAAERGDVNPIIAAYNKAELAHDEATEKYIAQMLDNSDKLSAAFALSGMKIEGGYEHLLELVKPATAADIRTMLPGAGKGVAPGPSITNMNFTGGITIKQDFRDQDPDRIAVIFRRDLANSASNRTQAKTSGSGTPFGA